MKITFPRVALLLFALSVTVSAQVEVQVKQAIEKSAPVTIDRGSYSVEISDQKIEMTQPCVMKFAFQEVQRSEDDDVTMKRVVEINWANVQNITTPNDRIKTYLSVIAKDGKHFKAKLVNNGKLVDDTAKQTVHIPFFHKNAAGYIDRAAFVPNAALIDQLWEKCSSPK